MTQLTLVIPGLLPEFAEPTLGAGAGVATPALNWLLARARPAAGPETAEAALAGLGGYAENGFPHARLRYLGETGRSPATPLLCADPVHLRADRDSVRLFDAGLDIRPDETAALAEAFNAFEAEAGLRLEFASPVHGYLHADSSLALITTPLSQVRGRDIDPFLPRGETARDWHARLNEWQMLFFQHPVNRQREEQGRPMLNGLWLWGEGELGTHRLDSVSLWGEAPALRGIALRHGAAGEPLPADPGGWLSGLAGGDHRVWLAALDVPAAYQDITQWLDALAGLERDWFSPARQAVKRGRIKRLILQPCNGRTFEIRPLDRFKWWRRVRPMGGHVQA